MRLSRAHEREAETEGLSDLRDRSQLRISLPAKSLIEGLAAQSRPSRQIGNPTGASDDAERMCDFGRITIFACCR
jgi:hypothetical protein